jgi:hypothetical protein
MYCKYCTVLTVSSSDDRLLIRRGSQTHVTRSIASWFVELCLASSNIALELLVDCSLTLQLTILKS